MINSCQLNKAHKPFLEFDTEHHLVFFRLRKVLFKYWSECVTRERRFYDWRPSSPQAELNIGHPGIQAVHIVELQWTKCYSIQCEHSVSLHAGGHCLHRPPGRGWAPTPHPLSP